MRIAVDAMGGDCAPDAIIEGAVAGHRKSGATLILTGDRKVIIPRLPNGLLQYIGVEVRDPSEPLYMKMVSQQHRLLQPVLRTSVGMAAHLVKSRDADCMLAFGDSGEATKAATLIIGRVAGVSKPPIMVVVKTLTGRRVVVMDGGAIADCKVGNLVEFARLGIIYSRTVIGIEKPIVRLLSIGGEEYKGNELLVGAHQALKRVFPEFAGNTEANDILKGEDADVVVGDAVSVNNWMKGAEGAIEVMLRALKEEVSQRSVVIHAAAYLLKPAIRAVKLRFDYDGYGAAQLLGLKGIALVGHGRSKAPAVSMAIETATQITGTGIVAALQEEMAKYAEKAGV